MATCGVTGSKLNCGVGLGLEVPCVFHFSGRSSYVDRLRTLINCS